MIPAPESWLGRVLSKRLASAPRRRDADGGLLVGIALVRNESDIIEPFVRHNLRYLDRLTVVDNDSADSTREMLEELESEGLPIRVKTDRTLVFHQSQIVNRELHHVLADPAVGHVFLLDADEFILAESPEALRQDLGLLSPGECGLLAWTTFVPTPSDDWGEPDPLKRIIHRRAHEPRAFHKLVVPRSAATPRLRVSEGNHRALAPDGSSLPMKVLRTRLAHFPVRSEGQLLSKAILGEWALQLKHGREPGESAHWMRMSRRFAPTLEIGRERLCEEARGYASGKGRSRRPDLLADPVRAAYDLKLAHLVEVDPTKRIVSFVDRLIGESAGRMLPGRHLLRSPSVAVKEARHGYVCYRPSDPAIGRSLDLYGEWGEGETALIEHLVRRGSVVVEVGANVGTHTAPLARAVGPKGVVHAFEPERHLFHLLCANIALNDMENVHAHRAAVGALSGEAGGVPVTTIDAMDLRALQLMKVAAGGTERAVLFGAAETIRRLKPALYLETDLEGPSRGLLEVVSSMSYTCWWHIEDCYNRDNFYRNPRNVFVGRQRVGLLCLATGSPPALGGLTRVVGKHDTWRSAWERSRTSQ